ncbi:MAG: LD-carboxypeptidase, partial [Lachnospiraceae bacterium]|nr:LD-carboxypeptidase [Lachnospiraceae bacterium]
MKIPAFLKPGDTIGLVAPSFGAVTEPYATRLRSAIETFEKRGYRVKCAPSVYKDDGLGISTDPESAAADLMEFYLD